jgi:hypothetical protein
MKKVALQIASNGNVTELDIAENSLKVLQTAVDGYIEAVDIFEDLTMWVNEEFLLRSEPDPNDIATAIFSMIGGNYAIHGTVVLTGGTDEEGNTLGLSPDIAEELKIIIADAKVEMSMM